MNWPDDYINTVVHGDALAVLRQMPDRVIQTCITSPPFWGLRDYGTATWEGGDPGCDHQPPDEAGHTKKPTAGQRQHAGRFAGPSCYKCGATRIDKQLGLERTPELYVAKLVEVFREVRRVLRDDATLWLNLGDSYNGYPANVTQGGGISGNNQHARHYKETGYGLAATNLKPKDLVGIPWLVAFALRSNGWYLRSDIIWHKPNPMPESVTDRPTKAHEYLFLLAKSQRYYYDADAIKEPYTNGTPGKPRAFTKKGNEDRNDTGRIYEAEDTGGRNKRSVWTIATEPHPYAHFATFPIKLVEPCILAGSAEIACGVCDAPYERIVERPERPVVDGSDIDRYGTGKSGVHRKVGQKYQDWMDANPPKTTGFRPTCDHDDNTGRSIILDPFMGSGTTGLRAQQLRRQWVGIELSQEYIDIAKQRLCQNELFNEVADG